MSEIPGIDAIEYDGSDEQSRVLEEALASLFGDAEPETDPEDDGRAPKPEPSDPIKSSENFLTWAKSGGVGQGLGLNVGVVAFNPDGRGVFVSDINGTLFELRQITEVPDLSRPADLPDLGQKILVTKVPEEFTVVADALPVMGWVTVPMGAPEEVLKTYGSLVSAYVKLPNGLRGVVLVSEFTLVLDGEVVSASTES